MEIVKKKRSVSKLNSVLPSKENKFIKKFIKGKYLFMLVIPTVVCMALFYYLPMWGILIAFKQYSPFKGLAGSSWVGFKHFKTFFGNPFFFRYFKNTILLSFYFQQ
jgi:putative aldouronate transport system permease protein